MICANPSNGSASIDPQSDLGIFTQANFFSTDSFSVSITDDLGNSSNQVISLNIQSVNDPTTLIGDVATINEDNNASGDIMQPIQTVLRMAYFLVLANHQMVLHLSTHNLDLGITHLRQISLARFFFGFNSQENSSNQVISLNVQSVNDIPYDLTLDNNKIQENLKLKLTGKVRVMTWNQMNRLFFSF